MSGIKLINLMPKQFVYRQTISNSWDHVLILCLLSSKNAPKNAFSYEI